MNYTNRNGVRFRIFENANRYQIKYYGAKAWPKKYNSYFCPTNETRNEVFYILSTLRLCSLCKDQLHDETRSTCQECVIREALANTIQEDQIAECPVCYAKMFKVTGTRRQLACRHEMCSVCMRRMVRAINGLTCSITCPLCRHQAVYDYSLNVYRHG